MLGAHRYSSQHVTGCPLTWVTRCISRTCIGSTGVARVAHCQLIKPDSVPGISCSSKQ